LTRLDLTELADEWQELLDEMGGNVPDTEGMSWGEVSDATEAFLKAPEQVAELAKYTDLCGELGVTPAEPDTLRWYDTNNGPEFIAEDDFEDYAREMAEDMDGIETSRWPYTCIDWEKAADELRQDYTTITYDGEDYLTR
jgi:antirestriction protein